MSFSDPFARALVWRFDPRGSIWSALTSRYEIVQQNFHGDTVRVVRRESAPVPVSSAGRDAQLKVIRGLVESEGPGATLDRQPRIPDFKPAIQTFYLDPGGFLWVEPSRAMEQSQRFDVFDPQGRFLGAVTSPRELTRSPQELFRRDAIYGIVQDSLDVQHVVRLAIRGRK